MIAGVRGGIIDALVTDEYTANSASAKTGMTRGSLLRHESKYGSSLAWNRFPRDPDLTARHREHLQPIQTAHRVSARGGGGKSVAAGSASPRQTSRQRIEVKGSNVREGRAVLSAV